MTSTVIEAAKDLTWLSLARSAVLCGDYGNAQQYFENVLKFKPDNKEALEYLVYWYIRTGDYPQATATCHQLLMVDGSDINSRISNVFCCICGGDARSAIENLNILTQLTWSARLQFCWSLLCERLGAYNRAHDEYTKVLSHDHLEPDVEAETTLHLAYVLACLKDYEIAQERLNALLESDIPTHVRMNASTMMGMVNELRGDLPGAESAHHTAISVSPHHSTPIERLIRIYLRFPKTVAAAKQWAQCSIVHASNNSTLWYLLGRAHAAEQQYEDALHAYRTAINLNPNCAEIWCSLGVIYQLHDQGHDALGMYARALAIQPNYSEAWFNVGMLYETAGQLIDANKSYVQAKEAKTIA